MARLRHGAVQTLGVLCLVALLLEPVVLGGHRHAGNQAASDTCALCIAAHHSPVVTTPSLPQVVTPHEGVAIAAAPVERPSGIFRRCSSSRAPPSFFAAYPV